MAQEYLIVGDGIAGATAAIELAQKADGGEITIVTDEAEPLYNRVTIKDYSKGTMTEEEVQIHDLSFYEDKDIELMLNTRVTEVRPDDHEVEINRGEDTLDFDKLLLATGGWPKDIPVDGWPAKGCYTFWNFVDARRIKEHAEESETGVAIGAGLLGIDIAVTFGMNDVDTKYLMRKDRWWRDGLDKEGSEIVERAMADKGIESVFHQTPERFITDDDGWITAVECDTGDVFECDIAGQAIGLDIYTDFLEGSGIKTNWGILADETMQTSHPDVYTAGDCAEYYDLILERKNINGSWGSAKEQGQVAAQNMMGNETVFRHVDSYSINHFDFHIMSLNEVVGDHHVSRKHDEGQYLRLSFEDERLIGATMLGDIAPVRYLRKLIDWKIPIQDKEEELLSKDFDASEVEDRREQVEDQRGDRDRMIKG